MKAHVRKQAIKLAGGTGPLAVVRSYERRARTPHHRSAGGDHRTSRGGSDASTQHNADDTALAIIRERAFQDDRFESGIPNERATRYREGVREAVASLLDPFQPDSDEASRLNDRSPARTRSPLTEC